MKYKTQLRITKPTKMCSDYAVLTMKIMDEDSYISIGQLEQLFSNFRKDILKEQQKRKK